jgi:hypothetical protein
MNYVEYKQEREYNYTPDSVYNNYNNDNGMCKNDFYAPVLDDKAKGPTRTLTFCPFGKGDSLNKSILDDQKYLYKTSNKNTRWGRVPQLDPRPLVKVGLEWRN